MTENTQQQQPEKRSIKTDTSPFLIAFLVAAVAYVHWSSMRFALFVLVAGLIIAFAYTAGLFNGIYDDVPDWFSRLLHGFRRQEKTEKDKSEIYDLFLGHDVNGKTMIKNLLEMGSIVIYGITGSGKSALIHLIINGVIVNHSPDEIRLIIADLKEGLEFKIYRKSRHLMYPIATDVTQAAVQIDALHAEMKRRSKLFKAVPQYRHSNSLKKYHQINDEMGLGLPKLPVIVAIVDEFQDITSSNSNALDDMIALAKKGRAFGIILIASTQSPRVDSIPGAFRDQFWTKICGYMANASNYYKLAEIPKVEWEPFHNKGFRPGWYIAQIAGIYYELNAWLVRDDEIEAVAKRNALSDAPVFPDLPERAEPIKRKWSGSADQKRAMLVEWFQHFDEMPTEAKFTDEFDASKRTYYDWVAKVWNEVK